MSELASKNCVPCRGGVPPLAGKELEALAQQVPQWKVVDGHHITRAFKFPDFRQALAFVNKVEMLAEGAGASSGHSAFVGQSGSHHVDAQHQWPDRERLYSGRQDRSTVSSQLWI